MTTGVAWINGRSHTAGTGGKRRAGIGGGGGVAYEVRGYNQGWADERAMPMLSVSDAKTVATGMVSSRLDYSNLILYGTSSSNSSKLQHMQNAQHAQWRWQKDVNISHQSLLASCHRSYWLQNCFNYVQDTCNPSNELLLWPAAAAMQTISAVEIHKSACSSFLECELVSPSTALHKAHHTSVSTSCA